MSDGTRTSWNEVLAQLEAHLDTVEDALDRDDATALLHATWQPPCDHTPSDPCHPRQAEAILERLRRLQQRLAATRDGVADELSTLDRRRTASNAYGDQSRPSDAQRA